MLIYKEECYQIINACIEVHKRMGCGFLEAVYQECLQLEFKNQGIPAVSQPKIELAYREEKLHQTFQPDFICFSNILLELKSVSALNDDHRAQVINYLNAGNFQLGILVNFGSRGKLEWERIAHTKTEKTPRLREDSPE